MSNNDPYDFDAVDEQEQVREELAIIRNNHRVEDFKEVISTSGGRRFIWGLLSEAGIYASSFDGTTQGTIYNEGSRNLGLKVLNLLNEVAPEAYVKMIKENEDYERHIANIQSGNTDSAD